MINELNDQDLRQLKRIDDDLIDPRSIMPIDLTLSPQDSLQVEVQNRPEIDGKMLYVSLNGVTIMRIAMRKIYVQMNNMNFN